MRVIVRKERTHPGAQLRFEDVDGMRITAFVTNTPTGQLADLELRHRRRTRCEDRIRIAKDTGLRSLPPEGLRSRPDLVHHRRARRGPRCLNGHARPCGPRGPPLGTQTPAAATVHEPRSHGPHGQEDLALPGRPRTLGGSGSPKRQRPTSPRRTQLTTSTAPAPTTPERPPGPRNRHPSPRHGDLRHTLTAESDLTQAHRRPNGPPQQLDERSKLVSRVVSS